MTGVIYARYSEGPHQTDQSIEGQVADCKEYAAAKDIDIIEIYADRHVSGKSITGREEFQRMLSDAAAHRFECVIVWKVDRFGRDRQDIALSKLKLKKAGVKLLYAKESVPDGPEGIILESLLEGLAEYYSADLRQKVQRGIRESAKKGKAQGVPPIGYKYDGNRHPVIDPEPAEAVREAFRMHNEDSSTKDIIEMFRQRGITTRNGNPMTSGTLYRILRNEKYTGRWTVGDVPLDVEPIISEETFEEAKNHFRTSRHNAQGKAQADYLLSCKVFCGYCGAMLDAESGHGRHGKVYNYYKCSAKKHKGKPCKLKPVPKETLEEAVTDATCKQVLTPEMIEALTEDILEVQDEQPDSVELKSLKKQLKDTQRRQKNILKALEEGTSSGAIQRLKELEDKASEISLLISKKEIQKPKLSAELVSDWLYSFREGDVTDPAFRKKLLETFVSRVDLWNDHALVYFNYTGREVPDSITISEVDFNRWYSNPCKPLVLEGLFVIYVDLSPA